MPAAIHDVHAAVATLLVAVAIGSLVAFMLIEPANPRAALRNPISGVSQKLILEFLFFWAARLSGQSSAQKCPTPRVSPYS